MRISCILILLATTCVLLSAQDPLLFQEDTIPVYRTGDSPDEDPYYRMTEVIYTNGTVDFTDNWSYEELTYFAPWCILNDGASIFGISADLNNEDGRWQIEINPIYDFYFPEDKSITDWTALEYDGGYRLTGHAGPWRDTMIFGAPDEIRNIQYELKDPEGQSIQMSEPMHWLESKQHGWIRFNALPDLMVYLLKGAEGELMQLNLHSYWDQNPELPDVSFTSIFSFEPGDVFHVRFEDLDRVDTAPSTYHKTVRKTKFGIREVLEASDDVFRYEVDRVYREEIIPPSGDIRITIDSLIDTLEYRESDFPYLLHWTDVPYQHPDYDKLWGKNQYLSRAGRTGVRLCPEWYFKQEDSPCYDYNWERSCEGIYLNGLGGPYYHKSGMSGTIIREPVYYSQGGEHWGEPFDFTVNNNHPKVEQAPLSVYPVPARAGERITVRSSCVIESIRWSNARSAGSAEQQIRFPQQTSFDLTCPDQNGMYFLIVRYENGQRAVKKIPVLDY